MSYLIQLRYKMLPYLTKALLCMCVFITSVNRVHAQFPYVETFKNATAKNIVISGASTLTAATSIDSQGSGYLRLNENTTYNVGYVYGINTFPSNFGISTSFEFFTYKPGATSTNQADGMTFFLFDASVNAFRPGGTGGSLGYAQYYSTPGMAKGYIGISIDEFGNFSSATDGTKNGGPGQRRSSVAIRGPGNGKSVTDYVYQAGVTTTDAAYNVGFSGFVQRYPDSTSANYRRIKIIMAPGSTLGVSLGYKITVIMYKGGTTVTPVTLINNLDYPFIAPARLQFGLAASTGSISNYHEIRNLTIDATNSIGLLPPVTANDNGVSACYGQQSIIDVTANDISVNSGGSINKATVDLDTVTAGIQKTFLDAGKGSYNVDTNGIVYFTAVNGFSGISSASYKVNDTYGVTSSIASSISFNVSNAAAPLLTLNDPSPVCSPATVDITNTVYKVATSAGASYNYFSTLTDANAGSNNINVSATAVSASGTYYIKATLSGCSTIKPIIVQRSSAPSTANAGADQSFCSSSGAQTATLLATNPDIGSGAWSQVTGPPAAISYPGAATTPLYNLSKGVYVFRYTVSNGGCAASMDDIQLSVGIAANAGSAQTVLNANNLTLAANSASPATGTWSQISGPAVTITDANNAASTITGLVPGSNYVMQWRIVNGTCTSSSQVTITNVLNTIADAGPDQIQTGLLDVALHGNNPGVGNTGAWSIVTAPSESIATLYLPASPSANLITLNKSGDYVLRWTISNGGYSNYDEMSLRVNSVLPVLWMRFEGVEKYNIVQLSWRTGMEENNDHFNIERSEDGIHFYVVGKVEAMNTSLGSEYAFSDDIYSVKALRLYYRIAQVDKDSKFNYSPIVTIQRRKDVSVSVWPNPVLSRLNIRISALQNETVKIVVSNAAGNAVASRIEQLTTGPNNIFITEVSNLPSGIYYISISGKQMNYTNTMLKR